MSQAKVNVETSARLGRRKKRGLLPVVIMGAGRLGESLITLGSFSLSGFTIVGVFDKDPKRVGVRFVTSSCGTHVVEPTVKLASRVHAHNVRRGIIAVPPSTAQEAADELIGAGINVILSYAPTDVNVPSNVLYSRVDPAMQFARMVPPFRLPWWVVPASSSSTASVTSPKTPNLGLARLPCMWTSFSEGSVSIVINPVLLTLVASGQDEDADNEDEETSTVTTASYAEDESPEGPGFFEYIQSNQKLFVTQQKLAPASNRSTLVGLEPQLDYIKEGLMFRDELVRTRGTLVYGPSGCGKSLLVKTLAQALQYVTFYFVNGEEESLVSAFRTAARASTNSSSIAVVVLENVDVLCRKRAFKSAFLSCTDNANFNSVFILATSNAPWDIDTGVLRHFERRAYIPLPDVEQRRRVLQNHFAGCTVGERLTLSDFAFVAVSLDEYSTSDVIAVAKNAGLSALKNGTPVARRDLLVSTTFVRPTFCREMLPLFASFSSRFGTDAPRNLSTPELQGSSNAYLSMYS